MTKVKLRMARVIRIRRRAEVGEGRAATGASTRRAVRRPAHGRLCDGLEIVGGDPAFEEQEDGDKALIVPEGAYVKVTMPAIPSWDLAEDGRLHKYSLLVAMRLDRLPPAAMPLFNGSGRPRRARASTRAWCTRMAAWGC